MKNLTQYPIVSALLLAALIMVSGCAAPTADAPDEGDVAGRPVTALTEQALKNATYPCEWDENGEITLMTGRFEGEPFVEEGATRLIVTLIEPVAFGDLDGDGVDEAVVILATNPGGSGTFISLEAMGNDDGTPVHLASYQLGDRVRAESLAIQDGQIVLEMVTHGPDDPMCCPTQKVTLTYRFDGEQLIKVSEETAAAEAPPALEGTQWTLVSYVNSQGATVTVLPGTEITAEFTADQIAGGAGCNRYFASYQVDGAGITFGPVGATKMWCAEPDGTMEQENDYLAALEAATGYQVEGDTLTLLDADGEPIATFTQAGGSDIVDITWQWTELIETEPASQSLVPDPENYTLVLRSDGTYQVQADCNLSSGSYTLEGNRLTLLPGPTTLAECEPDSLYDEYLAFLGQVVTFELDGEKLVLNLKEGVGKMGFVKGAAKAEITDITWQWAELVETEPASQSLVPDPEKYTLVLRSDDTYRVKADCNVGSGGYTLEGNNLTLEPGPMTLAECGPDSLFDEYLAFLGQVVTFELDEEKLVLNLKEGAGKMGFVKGAAEAKIVAITWQWTELIETEPASQSLVADPENYTLVLHSDGTYQVQADCNVGSGEYTLEGNNLTLLPGPMTLAECEPDSLYDEYLGFLGQVASFELDGEKLVLNLEDGAGKMGFAPGG
jgi:heat shock protein HslJ